MLRRKHGVLIDGMEEHPASFLIYRPGYPRKDKPSKKERQAIPQGLKEVKKEKTAVFQNRRTTIILSSEVPQGSR